MGPTQVTRSCLVYSRQRENHHQGANPKCDSYPALTTCCHLAYCPFELPCYRPRVLLMSAPNQDFLVPTTLSRAHGLNTELGYRKWSGCGSSSWSPTFFQRLAIGTPSHRPDQHTDHVRIVSLKEISAETLIPCQTPKLPRAVATFLWGGGVTSRSLHRCYVPTQPAIRWRN